MNVDFIEVTNGDKRTVLPKQTVGNNFPNALKLEEGKLYIDVNNKSYDEIMTCLRSDYYGANISGSCLNQLKTDATKLGFSKMVGVLSDQSGGEKNVQQPQPNQSNQSNQSNQIFDQPLKKNAMTGGSLNGGGIMDMIFGASQPKETILDGLTVTSDSDEQYTSLDQYNVNEEVDGQTKELLQKVAYDVNKMNFTKESSGLITNNELFQKFVDQKKKELDFTEALTETEQQEGGVRTKYRLLGGN